MTSTLSVQNHVYTPTWKLRRGQEQQQMVDSQALPLVSLLAVQREWGSQQWLRPSEQLQELKLGQRLHLQM